MSESPERDIESLSIGDASDMIGLELKFSL